MSDTQALADLSELVQHNPAAGRYGWKVAINATGAQRRLGLSHALAAPLDGRRLETSGTTCSFDESSQIYVEAELALELGTDVTTSLSLAELRARVASYTPCLELVDYSLPKGDLRSMLGHSFFHAGIVLGTPVPAQDFQPLAPGLPEIWSAGSTVRGRAEGAVPDDVVIAFRELAEWVLAAGGTLRRGQRVLCGSYIDPVPLPAGAALQVNFGQGWSLLEMRRS